MPQGEGRTSGGMETVAGRNCGKDPLLSHDGSGLESKSGSRKCIIAEIQSRVEKSPSGLVKVAFAGCTTSVFAVSFTLLDITAIGKAAMNTTEPTTVATKQPGRRMTTLPTIPPASISDAFPALTLHRPITVTHTTVNNFIFIKTTSCLSNAI